MHAGLIIRGTSSTLPIISSALPPLSKIHAQKMDGFFKEPLVAFSLIILQNISYNSKSGKDVYHIHSL